MLSLLGTRDERGASTYMGFHIKLFRDERFLLTRVVDTIDGASLLEHVFDVNAETEGLDGVRELADCRELKSVAGLSVGMTTASAEQETKKVGSRLAILTPPDNDLIYGMARAYQTLALESRAAVEVFRDYDAAINWLAEDAGDLASLRRLVENAE